MSQGEREFSKGRTMTEHKKILLADDDSHLIEYLSFFVPLLGSYEIEKAQDGMEAMAKVNAFEPELIILDILMPGMNGLEVIGNVRKNHPHVKILAITASTIATQDLIVLGAHDVLRKPFDLSALSQKIKQLLPGEKEVAPQENARMLVADDESFITEYLKDDFEALGLEVFTAQDGREAFRLFQQKGCNLAVLDLKMPKLNGTELIRLLRESSDPPVPKAIFVITAILGSSLNELKRLDCPIFQKPMNTELLKQTVLDACLKYGLTLKN